jgi:hypothetical protein
MKQLFFLVSILFTITCAGQSRGEKILYVFSDAVEARLDSSLSAWQKPKDLLFFLYLREDSSIYSVAIGDHPKKAYKSLYRLVKRTNRFAVVNKRLVPLIFDYDYLFSSPSDDISSFGHRDEQIVRSALLMHGPIIYFNARGNLLNSKNY